MLSRLRSIRHRMAAGILLHGHECAIEARERFAYGADMHAIEQVIQNSLPLAVVALIVAFVVLAKCAAFFVDSSVEIANKLKIPRLVIGLVLVSFATTSPELAVSLMSAVQDRPEIAFGNAIGSVICDDGLALALCGILAPAVIAVHPAVLKSSGVFLAIVSVLVFLFVAFDGTPTLTRGEGLVLIGLFVAYISYLYRQHKAGKMEEDAILEDIDHDRRSMGKDVALFLAGLVGIIIASHFIILSAEKIALAFGVPKSIVALVLVAFGTSVPEVATCVTAALKGEGALAVGNILGADIMNICWVAGASAIANDLVMGRKEIGFMFPWMFVIVGTMLALLRWKHSWSRRKGLAMLALYIAYVVSMLVCFPPGS
jgi:cation:H+ antiporter